MLKAKYIQTLSTPLPLPASFLSHPQLIALRFQNGLQLAQSIKSESRVPLLQDLD